MKRLVLPLIVVCSLAMLYAAVPAIAQSGDQNVTGNLTVAGSADVGGRGVFGGTGASAGSASIVVGASNGDYGMVGYNTLTSASAGQYLPARIDDYSSQLYFFQGMLKFRTTIDYPASLTTPLVFREAMNIQRNGDVGIGVTTPTASLQTHGAAVFGGTGSSAGSHSLVVGAANGDYGIVGYNTMPSTSAGQYQAARADYASQIYFLQGMLKFRTAGSHSAGSTISFVEAMTIDRAGSVGIGTAAPSARLDVAGNAHVAGNLVVDGAVTSKFQDIAEWVPATETIEAGTVVIVAPLNHVSASREAYDTRVAGVVSAQPGLILGEEGDSKVLVATTGRVKVRVDASNGAIREGDILVSSGIRGAAMKSEPVVLQGRKFHQPGTVIGKALEPLDKGSGEILVLLSMQ